MTFITIQFFLTIFTQAQDLHLSLVVTTKGHVISKGLFGVIVSTEKPTIFF